MRHLLKPPLIGGAVPTVMIVGALLAFAAGIPSRAQAAQSAQNSDWRRIEAALTLKPRADDPAKGAAGIQITGNPIAGARGIFVINVFPDGAAAGILERGDIITAVNGHAMDQITRAVMEISRHPPGTRVTVEFWRYPDGLAGLYRAAQADDAMATFLLGYFEQRSESGKPDAARMFGFYHRAAALGSVEGMTALATLYRDGHGVDRNPAEAARWYREAVDRGSTAAMVNLAQLIEAKMIDGATPAQAFELVGRAATAGDRAGHFLIAEFLDRGFGTARNPVSAAAHLIAAVYGNLDSGDAFIQAIQKRSRDFMLALQQQLRTAGRYAGKIDGQVNPELSAALTQLKTEGHR